MVGGLGDRRGIGGKTGRHARQRRIPHTRNHTAIHQRRRDHGIGALAFLNLTNDQNIGFLALFQTANLIVGMHGARRVDSEHGKRLFKRQLEIMVQGKGTLQHCRGIVIGAQHARHSVRHGVARRKVARMALPQQDVGCSHDGRHAMLASSARHL